MSTTTTDAALDLPTALAAAMLPRRAQVGFFASRMGLSIEAMAKVLADSPEEIAALALEIEAERQRQDALREQRTALRCRPEWSPIAQCVPSDHDGRRFRIAWRVFGGMPAVVLDDAGFDSRPGQWVVVTTAPVACGLIRTETELFLAVREPGTGRVLCHRVHDAQASDPRGLLRAVFERLLPTCVREAQDAGRAVEHDWELARSRYVREDGRVRRARWNLPEQERELS